MDIRKNVLIKTLIILSLSLSPALTHSAFAGKGGDNGPNGGRDSGGGHGDGTDECGNGPCDRVADGKTASTETVVVEIRSDEENTETR